MLLQGDGFAPSGATMVPTVVVDPALATAGSPNVNATADTARMLLAFMLLASMLPPNNSLPGRRPVFPLKLLDSGH